MSVQSAIARLHELYGGGQRVEMGLFIDPKAGVMIVNVWTAGKPETMSAVLIKDAEMMETTIANKQ